MGCGNVCTTGSYEGLFYIYNNDLRVYRRNDPYAKDEETRLQCDLNLEDLSGDEWLFDEIGSSNEEEDVLECFCEELRKIYPSFRPPIDKWDTWRDGTRRVLLENRLFYICVEDNEWSLAVELIQRDDDYRQLAGLQEWHYTHYLKGMEKALLSRLTKIGTYAGPWTHGTLAKKEFENG